MSLNDPSMRAFREEVRTFLAKELPAEIRRKQSLGIAHSKEELLEWQRILHRRGWVALHWPKEHGGTGWSIEQKFIFEEECALADAPDLLAQALTIVGPILIHAGTEEQKKHFLPRILDGTDVWCQGFSEPGAGSDLANLACKAAREGDEYVINGSKIWTSNGHWSDWCLLLARTANLGKKQRGITVLLVPMNATGVRVRPLPSLDGAHVLNQVYFDDVRVPVANCVGTENDGWTVLKAIIGNERILNANIGRSKAMLRRLDGILAREADGGRPLAEDAGFRRRVAQCRVELHALEYTVLRWMDDPLIAQKPETSILKLRGTELQQRISEIMSEAVAYHGLPFDPACVDGSAPVEPIGPDYAGSLTPFYFFWRKASISAGTNDVMRNMVAAELFRTDDPVPARVGLSEEQGLLADSAGRWAAEAYPFSDRAKRLGVPTQRDDALWRFFAEQGWLGIAVPEAHGGSGLGARETQLVMQGFGKALSVEPYLATAVLGAQAVLAAGSEAQKQALLPVLCEGKLRLAFAFAEPGARYDAADVSTKALKSGGGWSLSGRKAVVLGAPVADSIVVVARTAGAQRDRSGLSLFLVPASAKGLSRRDYRTVDGLAASDLVLDGVQLSADALLGTEGAAWEAIERTLDAGASAVIGEAVGVMELAVWSTRDYLKQRVQFDKPLSSFQVLQHRVVEMYIALEEARSIALWAAQTLDGHGDRQDGARAVDRSIAVSAAKAHIGDTGRTVGQGAVQLHGGMGIIEEFAIGHTLKRLTAIDRLFGDRWFHLDRYAALSGARR